MNKFLALIMDLTAVWMLLAIVYHDLSYNCSAWFGILAFFIIYFCIFYISRLIMNEVSIIINGVMYDAVGVDKHTMKCAYCDDTINMYCCNLSEDEGICFMFDLKDKCFKKSDKKFEV